MDLINCNCCSNSSCSAEPGPEAPRAFIATDKPVFDKPDRRVVIPSPWAPIGTMLAVLLLHL
jgi:hypothetical protein